MQRVAPKICRRLILVVAVAPMFGASPVQADDKATKPANLNVAQLEGGQPVVAPVSTTNKNVGIYMGGGAVSFDIGSATPTASLIMANPEPFGRPLGRQVTIQLIATEYTDPTYGMTGDIYRATIPDIGTRYFLLGKRGAERWVVDYDKNGQVLMFIPAMVGYLKSP